MPMAREAQPAGYIPTPTLPSTMKPPGAIVPAISMASIERSLPMSTLAIQDNVVWAKHVEDETLRNRILQLRAGERIELLVDGIAGRWEKMKTGRDGKPTTGIKPVGAMAEIWNERFFPRKGDRVPVQEIVTADSYLEGLAAGLSEWDSPQDEQAYRDLQPR